MKLKLSASVIEGKFIMADFYYECILGLDLKKKNGLIVNLKSRLLRAKYGDILLLVRETFAVQQVLSDVDSVQELVKPHKEILSAE